MRSRWMAAGIVAMAAALMAGGCKPTPEEMELAASRRSQIIGMEAPGFTLPDQDGNLVTLGNLRGKWVVLYFYPQDDTPGCTCQATEFTELLSQFRDMNAAVYGISGDSVRTHKTFIEKYNFTLDLLSDPNHEVMRAYGAWVDAALGPRTYGREIRETILIDPKGVIRYHWPEVIPKGHAARVRQRLAKLQAEATK
jgi:thioredoxin-dependent peroxiredoxin